MCTVLCATRLPQFQGETPDIETTLTLQGVGEDEGTTEILRQY